MMDYMLETGPYGVDILTAPYALLVEAFGNDGVNRRDTCKSMCQWEDKDETWEVYDYKVGTCYDREDGLSREQITEWHVQATEFGSVVLRALLDAAVRRIALRELTAEMPELPVGESEYLEVVQEQDAISDLIDALGDGSVVRVGAEDVDGFFVLGGLEISLGEGVTVETGGGNGGPRWVRSPLSLEEVRRAHAVLGAYLEMIDNRKA